MWNPKWTPRGHKGLETPLPQLWSAHPHRLRDPELFREPGRHLVNFCLQCLPLGQGSQVVHPAPARAPPGGGIVTFNPTIHKLAYSKLDKELGWNLPLSLVHTSLCNVSQRSKCRTFTWAIKPKTAAVTVPSGTGFRGCFVFIFCMLFICFRCSWTVTCRHPGFFLIPLQGDLKSANVRHWEQRPLILLSHWGDLLFKIEVKRLLHEPGQIPLSAFHGRDHRTSGSGAEFLWG